MRNALLIRTGNFFFRYRNALFPTMMILAALLARPRYPGGSAVANNWTDLAGFLIALMGQSLRILTIGYKYVIRGGRGRQVYAEDLVVGGVFAHSRNPMYVGNVTMFLGIAVMVHSTLMYAVGVPAMLYIYTAIVAAEEAFLRGKFGPAFDEYCKRVNRWIPDFRGFSKTVSGQPFQWQRVISKEYGTLNSLLVSSILVRVWSVWRVEGTLSRSQWIGWGSALLVTLAVFFGLLARKKRRRAMGLDV